MDDVKKQGGSRPGAGRPKSGNPRKMRQPIFATDDEWILVKVAAAAAGKSVNDYIILKAIGELNGK